MLVNTTVIQGDLAGKNRPPEIQNRRGGIVRIPGRFNGGVYNVELSEDILSKHALLVGGTGTGKTNVCYHLIHQIKKNMTQNDVMIIFDTKGDFFQKFYRNGDTVIANSKQYSKVSSEWNIYKEIVIDGWEDEEVFQNANEIMHSFFKEAISKSSQPFFPNAARDLMTAILIAHIRMGKDTLSYKQKYFNNKALREYLDRISVDEIRSLLSPTEFSDLSSTLSYVGTGESEQALGVMAEMQSVIRQILCGAFAKDGRFSVREFVRRKGGRVLFVEYDMSVGMTLAPMYRLLFDLALKEALGRNKSEGNVYLICDEFKLVPHLQHIEDGVNFGRGLGIKIIAGIQSVEQLYEIYGTSKGRNILAGFSSVYAFRTNDAATREFITKLYGKNMLLEQYSTSMNIQKEEKRSGNVVEDWDINRLQLGEAIIGLPFEKPFQFKFDLYKGGEK